MAGLQQAVPLYQESARGWRSTGDDVTLEVRTLEALAHMTGYFTQYNRESIAARERLAELYPATKERLLEIHNLRSLGTEYPGSGPARARQADRDAGIESGAGCRVQTECRGQRAESRRV